MSTLAPIRPAESRVEPDLEALLATEGHPCEVRLTPPGDWPTRTDAECAKPGAALAVIECTRCNKIWRLSLCAEHAQVVRDELCIGCGRWGRHPVCGGLALGEVVG